MNPFEVLVQNLNQIGFYGFVLPFLFIFVVMFGLLLKSKILTDDKKIIGVVSLVVAFFATGFGGPLFGAVFVNLFAVAAIVLAGILVIILFIVMAGGDISKLMESKGVLAVIVGIGIVVFAIVAGSLGGIKISESTIAAIFVLVVMAIAIAFIAKEK